MKISSFFPTLIFIILLGSTLFADGTRRDAPVFQLRDIDNRLIDSEKLRENGPIVVNFWTTWCVPCRSEMGALQKLHAKYSPNVSFIAISIDDHKTVGRVRSYVKSRKFPFIIVIDPDKELAARFQASVVPTTVIVGGDGNILYFHTGYKPGDEDKVEAIIIEALGKTK
jgi:cytochrome c biogenesis protein CcmG, thiol:disulfide interchange protein DsbE